MYKSNLNFKIEVRVCIHQIDARMPIKNNINITKNDLPLKKQQAFRSIYRNVVGLG